MLKNLPCIWLMTQSYPQNLTVSRCNICSLPTCLEMITKKLVLILLYKLSRGRRYKDCAKMITGDRDQNEVDILVSHPTSCPVVKFDGLEAMLELFLIMCLQEKWIDDQSKLSLVSLEGYSCYCVKPTASSHGGLIIYVDHLSEVTRIKKINNSDVWEGLSIELKQDSLKVDRA